MREIASFEIRYHLRQPLFYICTAIFFLLTFGAITTDSVQIGGAIGNVNRNAPFVIMQIGLVMSVIGVFVTTAFVANSVQRDFEHRTWSVFFSSPIRPADYLLGRFAGASTVAFLVFIGVIAAIMIGSRMPWLEPERIGPFMPLPYVFTLLVLILPNVLLSAAIFFSLAALTRSMFATYAGVAAFFVAYAISANIISDMENEFVASLLDPFGLAAFSVATKYWTVFERNNSVLSLDGALLMNRLVWLGISAAVLAVTLKRFEFTAVRIKGKRRRRLVEDTEAVVPAIDLAPARAKQEFSRSGAWRQFMTQYRMEILGIVRSTPFLVILFLASLNVVGSSTALEQLFGTDVYPVTGLMLQLIQSSFLLFVLIIMTFYSGELVFRERSLELDEVYDALPAPSWVFWSSKLAALISSVVLLLAAAMLTSMMVQLAYGYQNLQPLLYVQGLFLAVGVPFALVAVLALTFQVLTNNKYVGFLLMVLYIISGVVLNAMGYEHNLYQYAGAPDAPHSDMNGYGHFVRPLIWFYLYWSFAALLMLVLVHLFWVRGTERAFAIRRKIAAMRLGPAVRTVALAGAVGFLATGCYIFYNTNILNEYRTAKDLEKQAASFEKLYKKYENVPQPRIFDVKADVDIYPEERRVAIRGTYTLQNTTSRPISELHLLISPLVEIEKLSLPPHTLLNNDPENGYYIYSLTQPLFPDATMTLGFQLSVKNPGFVNSNSNTRVVYNGTFFDSYDYFPHLGYLRNFELQDRNKRRKYGLEPVQRMAKADDLGARMNNYLSREADWLSFETTVSTSQGQTAIAPGYLQRDWVENGRHYFHYRMDAPILGYWAYLSADYEVRRDRWNDVSIEIYYDRQHPYNVDRMIDAVKKSLDYFTANFSPYQHRQVRIIEFPRYSRFAQSFPNTIPFSESIGFIADLTDEEAIDYVFYVTAHEVAHQWWAHQVIGGNVQGSTMLSETLSQYSALMVMEKEYGREKMQRFLKYELDAYLRGRGGELVEEMPLVLVENQPYVHYRKGSLVMYALRDLLGEERVNAVLSEYIENVGFQQPPYTNSLELFERFRAVTPAEYQPALRDLFERITLFENRAVTATSTRRSDGRYAVTVEVEAKKFYDDGSGRETTAPVDDWIDVGVLGQPERGSKIGPVLALEKKKLSSGPARFEFVVDREPSKAGIDPLNKLIDRNPEDNLTSVGIER